MHHVRKVEAHRDLWWTRDGIEWFQVSHIEHGDCSSNMAGARTGKVCPDTIKSSCESYQYEGSFDNSGLRYLGKFGHTMTPFRPISVDTAALFFMGGSTDDEENPSFVPDVFQSMNGILYDVYDPSDDTSKQQGGSFKTCGGHGVCGVILPKD